MNFSLNQVLNAKFELFFSSPVIWWVIINFQRKTDSEQTHLSCVGFPQAPQIQCLRVVLCRGPRRFSIFPETSYCALLKKKRNNYPLGLDRWKPAPLEVDMGRKREPWPADRKVVLHGSNLGGRGRRRSWNVCFVQSTEVYLIRTLKNNTWSIYLVFF